MKEKKPAAVSGSSSGTGSADPSPSTDSVTSRQSSMERKSLGAIAGTLLFAGLASPFLELQNGISGLIGLLIIFVGMRIAWKMTGAPRLDILGPFQANGPPTAPAVGT
jgi:hypothetical protein